jgi:hypothetical protein
MHNEAFKLESISNIADYAFIYSWLEATPTLPGQQWERHLAATKEKALVT